MLFQFECSECGEIIERLITIKEKSEIDKGREVGCPKCDKLVEVVPLIGNCHFKRFWNKL